MIFLCFDFFYNDFPKCDSYLHHLAFGRITHFKFTLQLGKKNVSCFVVLIISPLFSLLNTLILWIWIFCIHLLSLLSFPMFSLSLSFLPSSREQTRWYVPILLLKFYSGNLIFNSIWYSLTSHVNETKGSVTTPDFFPNCSCHTFSTWLLLAWISLWFAVLFLTFAFGTGNSWTIFCKLLWDISLDPIGSWHHMCF